MEIGSIAKIAAITIPFFVSLYLRARDEEVNTESPSVVEPSSSSSSETFIPVRGCKNCKCFNGCTTDESYSEEDVKNILETLRTSNVDNDLGFMPKTDVQIYIVRSKRKEWEDVINKDQLTKNIELFCKRELGKSLKKDIRIFWLEGNQEDDKFSLLFVPDMIYAKDIAPENIESTIESYFSDKRNANTKNISTLHGTHIFICCHESRDEFCGRSGNVMFDKFATEIETSQFQSLLRKLPHENMKNIYLHKTSCLSGHKYPANVIIVRWDNNQQKYYGDSYGYVTPDDVPILLKEHVLNGKVVTKNFKGRISLPPSMKEKFLRFVDQA